MYNSIYMTDTTVLSLFDNCDEVYTEAVFANGRKKMEKIEKIVTDIKDVFDQEMAKSEKEYSKDNSKKHGSFNPRNFWKHKLFNDLENEIKKTFGCAHCSVQPYPEKYDHSNKEFESREINCMMTSSRRFLIEGLVTDDGFYDKSHTMVIDILVSLGLFKILEPSEFVAIMLHEFGHGIDPALFDINYAKANNLSKYLTDRSKERDPSEVKIVTKLFGRRKLSDGTVIAGFIKSLSKTFSRDKDIKSLLKANPLRKLFRGKFNNTLDLISEKIENDPLFDKYHYSEAFADNVARMYGYGPDLARSLKKMQSGYDDSICKRSKLEVTRQKMILDLSVRLVNDIHKTDLHRYKSLIREYKNDIDDPSTPAIVKKQLREDLKEVEKLYKLVANDSNKHKARINKVIDEAIDEADKKAKKG